MLIDKSKIYTIEKYSYKNFSCLSEDEVKLVWVWRNHDDVRKWMVTKDIIPFESHCSFVAGLKERDDKYYWLVFKNDVPIGVLSIIKVNHEKEEGEPGYYLSPDYANSGIGIDFQFFYKKFFFDELGFKNLFGHILHGNTNAYQLSRFFGSIDDAIEEIDGRKYIKAHTPVEEFLKLTPDKLINKFVKFCKENPVIW